MAAPIDLNAARRNLGEALGDNLTIYFQNLKNWFKQKISKEDFDFESRKLLKPEEVHLHNEFLLAILSRCQMLGSTLSNQSVVPVKLSKKGKLKRKHPDGRSDFIQRFCPVNPVQYIPTVNIRSTEDEPRLGFAAREGLLPDDSMIHGRMLVCAWEAGLQEVNESCVKLMSQAVERQLKNILTTVLSRRSGYKLRHNKFPFAIGGNVSNPYLRQNHLTHDYSLNEERTKLSVTGNQIPCLRPPVEIGEASAAQQISMVTTPSSEKGNVTLYDVLDALQLNKNVIPAHSVYAPMIERIIHKLWHPSNEDLDQDSIHQQEISLKQQIASQQAAVR
ncbi:hypothetical protein LOTGIDRAFT_225644 [Lottia gigantea]|uniref:Uncharacterized protein n=1 Tax=Lottia gigantea TaxID=225164 RepID=V4CFU6_LOTGI|nr:hypothetical protein LOTGIDRAFT_225644 [Lottia gigantea]ESP00905.1 hypothetical protein LOTGIDRAFT_225644 [Lottia gigantea]